MLLLVQFVYNSVISKPIRTLLFFANHSYQPTIYKQPQVDNDKTEVAVIYVNYIRRFQEQLVLNLEFINQRLAEYINQKQSIEPLLKKGDRVYLLRRNIKTKRPSNKLDFKKLGLFQVTEVVSLVNYQLQLPKNSRLYTIFHVLLLELV